MADIFPELRAIQNTTDTIASTASNFKTNLLQVMILAVEAGTRVATISTTAAPVGDILNTISALNTLGYVATIGGSTLTVTW